MSHYISRSNDGDITKKKDKSDSNIINNDKGDIDDKSDDDDNGNNNSDDNNTVFDDRSTKRPVTMTMTDYNLAAIYKSLSRHFASIAVSCSLVTLKELSLRFLKLNPRPEITDYENLTVMEWILKIKIAVQFVAR